MKTRFIRSIIATAEQTEVEMPWKRGKRRQAFIAKRADKAVNKRKTA